MAKIQKYREKQRPANLFNPCSHFMLLELPQELRDEIYGYLVHSGDLAILQVSRQTTSEVLHRIYTKASFRFYVNSAEACRNVQPQENVALKIQNLELQWDLSNFDCQRNSHELITFCQKRGVTRNTCHIVLIADISRAALLNANDISALRNLRVFRTVTLETRIKDSTQAITSARLAKFRYRVLSMFRALGDKLKLTLGPADQRGDADARQLVFRPASMEGSQFGELPPSKTAYSW